MRTRSAAATTGGGAGAAGGAAAGEEDESALSGGLLNATEAKMRLTELVGEGLAAELADVAWKVRLVSKCCEVPVPSVDMPILTCVSQLLRYQVCLLNCCVCL